jgi:glycosyltransferase involved in cell wall biosynthesis
LYTWFAEKGGRSLKPVILIPSLNPDLRLVELADALITAGFTDIIVVNDGSKAAFRPIFDTLSQKGCHVFTHAVNLGKGRALKTGINSFLNLYPDRNGMITADADGQHGVSDIGRMAKAMETMPNALILGVRNFDQSDVPFKSRAGNKITRTLFGYLSGMKLTDTQTGLRGIPKSAMPWMMEIKGERFEYEMNMLIESKRHNMDILEVPIKTIYIDENSSSHFHPVRDALRIYSILGKFAFSSISSALLDAVIFTLITEIFLPGFAERIAVGTVIARLCSSLCNYSINRHIVFQGNHQSGTMLRYYILAAFQMLISLFSVRALTPLLGWAPIFVKAPVDFILFLVSFKVQQKWVFKNKSGKVHTFTEQTENV